MKPLGKLCIGVVLILSLSPVIQAQTVEESAKGESLEILPVAMVFGLFPRVSTHSITYFAIPQLQVMTIPTDQFTGYLGIFIIFGQYNPNPYV